MKSYNVTIFDLVFFHAEKTPISLQTICGNFFEEFKQYTIDELWDSKEELIQHYQNPHEYEKLLNGSAGQNVAFYFHAIAISEQMSDFTDFCIKNCKKN